MSATPPELQELVDGLRDRWAVPGAVVGVLNNGEARSWAFGTADLEAGQPVTPSTLFQVGSITKIFTATALMQLVDAWSVDLDAPVTRYVDGFALSTPEATEALIVRHLLTHVGGFWGDDFTSFGRGDDATARVVASLGRRKQLTAPGELWHYNNAAFVLAGRLIEVVSGKGFEEYVTERVIRPLGLERTMWRAEQAISFPRAVPYLTSNELENKPSRVYELPGGHNPAGAIISTVGDLLAFARFHLGDGTANGKRVLSPGSLAAMQTPQVAAVGLAPEWGLGWGVGSIDGVRMVSHGGAWTGFRASLLLVPGRDFAVAVLTNGSNGTALYRHVNRWALRTYAGLNERDPEPIQMDARELDRYAGRFSTPAGEVTVTVAEGGLKVEGIQQGQTPQEWVPLPTAHAVPVGSHQFLVTDTVLEGQVSDYVFNPDGSVRFRRSGGRLQLPSR